MCDLPGYRGKPGGDSNRHQAQHDPKRCHGPFRPDLGVEHGVFLLSTFDATTIKILVNPVVEL